MFFLCQYFVKVVKMIFSFKMALHFKLSIFVLLCFSSLFAVEKIDCIDPEGEYDQRCIYVAIGDVKGINLFVVETGMSLVRKNALPNEDFYVFHPTVESSNALFPKDSLRVSLINESSKDSLLTTNNNPVNSGPDSIVTLKVVADYATYNSPVGTAIKSDGSDANIVRIYNFYVPVLKYFDKDGKAISEETILSGEVGSEIEIEVRAVIPIGPKTQQLDSSINDKDFFIHVPSSSPLGFYNDKGESLNLNDSTVLIKLFNGSTNIIVKADKAVDGADFKVEGYPRETSTGTNTFLVSEAFPGGLTFVNKGLPTLDSASIFDSNGDGIGDSIVAWFSGETDAVTMVAGGTEYSWPDGESFVTFGGDYLYNESKGILQLIDVETTYPKDSGEGILRVSVEAKAGEAKAILEADIQDRIGAAIRTASLIKGSEEVDDTLVVRFNKDIDPEFEEGDAFYVNGDLVFVQAIKKEGDLWRFAVEKGSVAKGDSISISISGGIVAADGNKTKNNQKVIVTDAGRTYISNEKNGFYDRNDDGQMDSMSVGFESPITREQLDSMDFRFYWLDSTGSVVEIKPDPKDLSLSSDGLVVGYAIDPEDYGIMKNLTSIDSSYSAKGEEYGYAARISKITVDGKDHTEYDYFDMNDRMAPVIKTTFLNPESKRTVFPDELVIEFSEAIDYEKIKSIDGFISFGIDGDWGVTDLTNAHWSEDGKTLSLYISQGSKLFDRANPGDSLRLEKVKDGILDLAGNTVSETSPVVMIKGDPRVVMESASLVSLERAVLLADKAAFTERFFPPGTSVKEEMGKSLGVMLDVAFSTILGDSAKEEVDLNSAGLYWELYVYTNLGAYVASAKGEIKCDDDSFGGNCFENQNRLYLRWNMRSEEGRKVGVGVYVAKFMIKVYGARESYETYRVFNWGIKSGKDGLSLE
jgi:hypothetical protein